MDLYAVIGNPVSHSQSPFIHHVFAKQTGQDIEYTKILAPLDALEKTINDFIHRGGKGINITIPFKQEALSLVTDLSPRAQLAGAINTILFDEHNQHFGDNTDGIGLVNDLSKNLKIELRNKKILLVGAGGAIQGIIPSLAEKQPRHVIISNRTVQKAEQLASRFSDIGNFTACGFDNLNDEFDIIINGTSINLQKATLPLPETLCKNNPICYDLSYSTKKTNFLAWCENHGVTSCFDGTGMLVEQAAESFYIWRGVRPLTLPVIKMLSELR